MERELGWWRKYVFSTDHKVIGIQYAISGLVFLFCLMMMMRWQLAYPGKPLPIIGKLFGSSMPGGVMTPDFYNSLGAMHGTIMVFLGIIPVAFAGFGNYIVPLQIGAPDMAFPKVNMFGYWALVIGAVTLLASFFLPTGAAASGWSSYTPLADIAQLGHGHAILTGQSFWLIGIVFLATSSVLGSINFITTIVQLRAPGMTWMRLPFFVWTEFVAGFLLLLAFPPMEAGTIMQLMDRIAGTSFYLPSGLVVNGQQMLVAGGGSPLLWQHLFWFLIHPEVYVLVLPAMGIVAEIVANNTRKPLYGYRGMVFSALISSGASSTAKKSTTTHGKPPRWSGPRLRRRRTEILQSRLLCIADPTITASAGRRRISARRTRPLLRQRKKRPSPDRSRPHKFTVGKGQGRMWI
jgi:cytochrome c oxidase subunit I